MLTNDEVADADKTTFFIERWIDHVVTKMKSESENESKSSSTSKHDNPQDTADANEIQQVLTDERTYDEKINAVIQLVARVFLRSISLEVHNASVVISGAGSGYVKSVRKQNNPHDANMLLAKLPRNERSLTLVGVDMISVSFSPDAECNALLCCVGVNVKVGDPLPFKQGDHSVRSDESSVGSNPDDIPYAWHVIAHPFHAVVEVNGVLSFLTWTLNYDHYWETRHLGLRVSSSEVAVVVSPNHLHTVLLHLDDFTDANSPFNEWIRWVKGNFIKTLGITESEEEAYCQNYAKLKGAKLEGGATREIVHLTKVQMKVMEKRLTRHDILSLRCTAMKKTWVIPKGSKQIRDFLFNSRSSISKEESSQNETSSPFEKVYPTPLHALVTLIREKAAIFAPSAEIALFFNALHVDFSPDNENRWKRSVDISSSVTVLGASLKLEQLNPLFSYDESVDPVDGPRSFLDLQVAAYGIDWSVANADRSGYDLPLLRDSSPVGIVYTVSVFCRLYQF